MRDSFVFYRSFFEALEDLNPKDKLTAYVTVVNYALNGKINEISGVPRAIFKLIKPLIDKNNKRWENGKQGGRPKKEKPNNNQTITKPKPNVICNMSNVICIKEDKKKYIKKKYGEFEKVLLSEQEYQKLIQIYKGDHYLEEAIAILDSYLKNKPKKKYISCYAVLGKTQWVYKRVFEDKKPAKKSQMERNREMMMKELDMEVGDVEQKNTCRTIR